MSTGRSLHRITTTFALLGFALLPTLARAATTPTDLPRYDLRVGRTLSYSSSSSSKEADGKPGSESHSTLRVTVVAANADGSRRVILRSASTYGHGPEDVSLGAFDIAPDGRAKPVGRPNFRVDSTTAFPPLPPDAAAASAKWAEPADWTGNVTTYTPDALADGAFVFTGVTDGPVEHIYVSTRKLTIHFDRHKGVIDRVDGQFSQGYGFHQTGTFKMSLDKDESITAAKAAELAAAYQKLFDADAEYAEVFKQLEERPADAAKLVDDASAKFKHAAEGVTDPEVAKEFDDRIKRHEQNAKEMVDESKKMADRLNKPAPDWEAKDLDGKTWRLSELKGKVVVMDFWYRGCGWCMYAMPQVKQLAADYKDKPVVILGMNTDQKEEDAHFVVKELGLTYPQIKAAGIPDKFGVQGFPTLIIVDPTGTIRAFDVGYSPDLREKVSKKIDAALQKPAT